MIIIFGLLATLGYSLQGSLLAYYARSTDALSLVAYRGLSLALTMWPLLFFVPAGGFFLPPEALIRLGIVAILCTAANALSNLTYRYLPVGIATAVAIGSGTVVAMLIEGLILNRPLSTAQLILVLLLLATVGALAAARSTGTEPEHYSLSRGITAGLGFGLTIGVVWILVGSLTERHHPFLIGYLWETSVGLFALFAAFARGMLTSQGGFQRVTLRKATGIGLRSSPTILGTGAYSYALTLGPVAIPSAILGMMVAINSVLAMFLYGERLSSRQWGYVCFSAVILAALKLAG